MSVSPTVPVIDPDYVKDQLIRLVSIDSRNPTLTPGAPGEGEIASHIASELKRLGLETTIQETSDPERPNVVAKAPGRSPLTHPSLMLNGHMDTVNVEGMDGPFAPRERDGRIYGRGSQDMKGSLAVMLGAARTLAEQGFPQPGDLVLTFVSDEEADSIGMEALVKEFRTDRALVLEPSELRPVTAHKGFVWYRIVSEGRAAHGSRYWEGIDAIANMGHMLREVSQAAETLSRREPLTKAGPPSVHVATIEGGTEYSVYAARCEAVIERRTAPEESESEVDSEMARMLNSAMLAGRDSRLSMETILVRRPFQTRTDSSLLKALKEELRKQGRSDTEVGVPFWTDAALLEETGSDCVIVGPHGDGLHTEEEWVSLQSLDDLGSLLMELILRPAPGT